MEEATPPSGNGLRNLGKLTGGCFVGAPFLKDHLIGVIFSFAVPPYFIPIISAFEYPVQTNARSPATNVLEALEWFSY